MAKKSPVKKSDVKPKAKKGAKSASPVASDFSLVFEGLKKVLRAFEPELRVTADEPRKYYLITKSNSWKGGPMFFGAVMMFKGYVS